MTGFAVVFVQNFHTALTDYTQNYRNNFTLIKKPLSSVNQGYINFKMLPRTVHLALFYHQALHHTQVKKICKGILEPALAGPSHFTISNACEYMSRHFIK